MMRLHIVSSTVSYPNHWLDASRREYIRAELFDKLCITWNYRTNDIVRMHEQVGMITFGGTSSVW